MQPQQDPTETRNCSPILLTGRQQYIEYLEKKQSIFQQRDQRTTNPLSLLVATARPTPGNASWNLTSDMSESSSPTDSTISTASAWTGKLRNGSINSHHHRYSQFQEDQRSSISNNVSMDNPAISPPDLDDTTISEFVKKLYRMLTEPTFQPFVCWGPQGDTFIVKNMHECTEFVLPRLFKHTNFSSFIRQLNKYGFRKVNPTQGAQYGVHSWTFQHPHFREGHPEAFERVIRKPSIPRRAPIASRSPRPHSVAQFTSTAQLNTSPGWHNLDARLTTLERNHADMHTALNNCEQFLHHLVSRFCQNPKGTDSIESGLDLSQSNPGSDINRQLYPSGLGLSRGQPELSPDPTFAASPYNPRLAQTPFGSSNLLSIPCPQSPPDSTSSTLTSNLSQIYPRRRYSADIWGSSSSASPQTPFPEFDDNKCLFG